MEQKWHSLSQQELFKQLETSSRGLSQQDAENRIKKYGLNTLPIKNPPSIFFTFLQQFNSPLIFILIAACFVSYAIGEEMDAYIILAVLVFNSIVGTIQEGKAQNTLSALRNFVETKATVLRDGVAIIIPDYNLVPGDIIELEEGGKVPADSRIIISKNLKTDEASLTGESGAIYKTVDIPVDEVKTIGDQKNMLFKGTNVVSGSGKAIVVSTGIKTVMGSIAEKISSIKSEIPLQKNIKDLSKAIILVVALVCSFLFVIGIIKGESATTMFTVVVSMAVSIIPEGLPIVMTLILATGVWRMSKKNALVKKLQAVEALGQAKVIAVDKTGTITKNELVVRHVWTAGDMFSIGGVGYESTGDITFNNKVINAVNNQNLLDIGRMVALCAVAKLSFSEAEKKWYVAGDPTEAAMVVFSEKVGFHQEELLNELPLVVEIPFDYTNKRRITVNKIEESNFMTIIGAPEVILNSSTKIKTVDGIKKLTDKDLEKLEGILEDLSKEGERVVAVGMRENVTGIPDDKLANDIIFVGFLGMKDVLRTEVRDAMEKANSAGIKVVMITGDHKVTAKTIACEAGIYKEGDEILTGTDVDELTDEELANKLTNVTVFARVTPEHKLKIINAFKSRGEIVAMTGDGVNDAPSLVAADLGVAMGGIGTEVAKEAADIVLLDDNFGSIISAVEEGRSVYKTIKKVMVYLFSTSLGEVLTIGVALIIGLPLPILAAQIIWLNFVTDGFLDVSLAMEPKEDDLLTSTFEKPKKYLVDGAMLRRMFVMAIPMMIGTLYLFNKYIELDYEKIWTISLTTLAMFQWFNAWNCRSDTKSIFQMNPFSNLYLVGATFLVIFLQILALYTPFLQKILTTVPLSLNDWLTMLPVAFSIIIVEETRKFFVRRKLKNTVKHK